MKHHFGVYMYNFIYTIYEYIFPLLSWVYAVLELQRAYELPL